MFKNSHGQRIVLGSSSPRRRELLAGCGLEFEIFSPDIDEQVLAGEKAQQLVERLAFEKGACISAKQPDAWVLAADTVVVLDDQILGKPLDEADAARMLAMLQGRSHQVWGGIALINLSRRIEHVSSFHSYVAIKALSSNQIAAYIKTKEPMDKAGSYAIQGIGAGLVTEVQGSYSNVVGLNIAAVLDLLQQYQVISLASGVEK
jgi:septum formation protein